MEPPNLRGRVYPLTDELTLGRAAGCQVPIDDSYASQVHARVFQRDGTWYVEDLGSTNGTLVNGRRVTRQALADGDVIRIGHSVLVYRQEPS